MSRILRSFSAPPAGAAAAIILLLLSVCPAPAPAAAPAWWSTALNANPQQNNAAATMGQAMHMVKEARNRTQTALAGVTVDGQTGAGAEINALLTAYNPAWNNRAIRIGQLKTLAAPFWKRLQKAGAPGIAPAPASPFPWTETMADNNDSALATLGQVKSAFSFEFPAPSALVILPYGGAGAQLKAWLQDAPGDPTVSTGPLSGNQTFPFGPAGAAVTFASGHPIRVKKAVPGVSHAYILSGVLAVNSEFYYGEGPSYVTLLGGTEVFFQSGINHYIARGRPASSQALRYGASYNGSLGGTAHFPHTAVFMAGMPVNFYRHDGTLGCVSGGFLRGDQDIVCDEVKTESSPSPYNDRVKLKSGSPVILRHFRQQQWGYTVLNPYLHGVAAEGTTAAVSSCTSGFDRYSNGRWYTDFTVPVGRFTLSQDAFEGMWLRVFTPIAAVQADSDNDGIPDAWESANGLNPAVKDSALDPDNDGLSSLQEYYFSLLPGNSAMNPTQSTGTDTNGNGIGDDAEIYYFGSLQNFSAADLASDTDGDGVILTAEMLSGLNPFDGDTDGDGVPDADELANWDKDGDLLPDVWEVLNGLDPTSATGANGGQGAPDGDGLSNLEEWSWKTDPLRADSDGDGASDSVEANSGGNPNDPADNGAPPAESDLCLYKLEIGDHSNSHSERYSVKIYEFTAGGAEKELREVISPDFGMVTTPPVTVKLHARKQYRLKLHWMGTAPALEQGDTDHSYPDYDWTFRLTPEPLPLSAPNYHLQIDGFDPASGQAGTRKLLGIKDGSLYQYTATAVTQWGTDIEKLRVLLLPVELAPDVLTVNADFDEAQINTNTGRPLPDCDNNTLIAWKSLPWSSHILGSAVFDELHEGWFGVSPVTLEPSFYIGASVKIAKIIQTDPATGTPESGHVTLWITAGSGTAVQEWKVDPYDRNSPGFTPAELVGLVYGPNATIPNSGSGKRYWIEGTKAGKCTLEFTYTKGAVSFKHRQTFEVGCQWTPSQWKEVVRQHVFIESDHSRGGPGADIAGLDIALGFMPNRDRCRAVYQYYGSLFMERQNEFHWLGLAKRAGASVYWGFSDSQYAVETWPTSAIPATVQTATSFQQALLRGMRDIFDDIGWQFMAYHVGGVKEMRFLNETGAIQDDYLTAWNQMAEGYSQNQPGLVDDASLGIARQEQEFVLLPSFTAVSTITTWGVPLDWILSIFSVNPVPGGLSFFQFNPNGNITDFNDRWPWIENPWSGMLLKWKQQGILGRPPLVQPYIEFIAEDLSISWGFGYPIK